MKIDKLIVFAMLIFGVLLSSCGRKRENSKSEILPPKQVSSLKAEQEEETEDLPQIITYSVILKDSTLSLYEVNGENKKRITSMEISPELYPKEDIERLKNGIEAFCLEDGYEILENFAN